MTKQLGITSLLFGGFVAACHAGGVYLIGEPVSVRQFVGNVVVISVAAWIWMRFTQEKRSS